MANAEYNSITCKITSPIENNDYRHNFQECIFDGWEILETKDQTVEKEQYDYIAKLKEKGKIKFTKVKADCSLKQKKLHYNEAKLVSILEDKGIGRPSTFASLISKIQERNYVKIDDVDGEERSVINYSLERDCEIVEKEETKIFGNEKNKLVIQPLGIIVCEYLYNNYVELFKYEYTKNMETQLDKISKNEYSKESLLTECYDLIQSFKEKTNEQNKITIQIDDHHKYMIGRYGPVIQKKIDGKISYLKVKPNIDIHKLEQGKYNIEDITFEPTMKQNEIIGDIEDKPIILRKGNYGYYIQYNNTNISLTKITGDKRFSSKKYQLKKDDLDIDTIINYLKNPDKQLNESNILVELNNNLCIKKGPYGNYIFYKNKAMTKPRFLKLKGFELDPITCDKHELLCWIEDKYGIK